MPKSRVKTRENKKIYAALNHTNEYGAKDPTPYEAVEILRKRVLSKQKKERK